MNCANIVSVHTIPTDPQPYTEEDELDLYQQSRTYEGVNSSTTKPASTQTPNAEDLRKLYDRVTCSHCSKNVSPEVTNEMITNRILCLLLLLLM
jgi:hypothetical protein